MRGDWPARSFPETACRVLKPSRISEKSSQPQPSGFSTATLRINSQSHWQQKIHRIPSEFHPLLLYDGWYLENRNGFTKRATTIFLGSLNSMWAGNEHKPNLQDCLQVRLYIYPWLIHDLSMTYIHDLSMTYPWPIISLSITFRQLGDLPIWRMD